MNINVIIGIIMILSFLGMVWYCVKGFNLMVGFAIMATFWTALALVGNAFSPTSAMEGKTFIQVLEYVYAEGPAGYAKSILVNVFFGAFFGRVLVDTGIAATLIRKVVELGGDKPRITNRFGHYLYVHDRYRTCYFHRGYRTAHSAFTGHSGSCGHVQLYGIYHGRHLWKYRQFPAVPDHICGL